MLPRKLRGSILSLIGVMATIFATQVALAQRAIPDDNLAYPVLITLGDGSSGTGFYLNADKATYLVTAKHVFFDQQTHALLSDRAELLSYSKDPSDATPNRFSLDLSVLQKSKDIRAHAVEDVVAIKLFNIVQAGQTGQRAVAAEPGVKAEGTAKAGILGVDITGVKRFDQVLVGNDVMVFGYPRSLDLKTLAQLDPNRPLLRKGLVAGTNPQKRSLILDCPVYFGNSGGPVLEIDPTGLGNEKLSIIGVVIQFVPFVQSAGSQTVAVQVMSNSGYSVAEPMDLVLDLINDPAVPLQQ
jgi:trypsin-like peptidase